MPAGAPIRSVKGMKKTEKKTPETVAGVRPALQWQLVLGLGAIALIRPLARLTGLDLGTPQGAWLLTGLVTAVWVGVVGLGRVPRPVLTLTLAGLAFGLFIIPLSAVMSTVLTGSVQGPAAMPIAVVPILIMNGGWGALSGLLALAVQRLRGGRP